MGDAGTVGELVALGVKGKQERLAPRLQRARRDPETGHLSHNATHGRRTYRAQACRKRIGFTEFLTLLRLLTKKAFMNGNKRVVTCSLTVV